MNIASYTPDFTVAELNRTHLTARDTCHLVNTGFESTGETLTQSRNRLNNIEAFTDIITHERKPRGLTSRKLYSVKTAIMFRCVNDLTYNRANKKKFEFAAKIAKKVGELAEFLVSDNNDLINIGYGGDQDYYVAYGSTDQFPPSIFKPGDFNAANVMRTADIGIYSANWLIFNALLHYPDYWHRNIEENRKETNKPNAVP